MLFIYLFIYFFLYEGFFFKFNFYPVHPDQGEPVGQREASRPGEFLRSGERANARRAEPVARGGGGCQEQSQPGVLSAGGVGEAEEGAECHAAGEEDHRGLGAKLQGRNGESKTGATDASLSTMNI